MKDPNRGHRCSGSTKLTAENLIVDTCSRLESIGSARQAVVSVGLKEISGASESGSDVFRLRLFSF